MFDFALYENVTTGINHQKDLEIIARLLKDSGFNVCVLGYCKEKGSDNDIPYIKIQNPYRVPEMEVGSKWSFLIRKIRYRINKKKYIDYFLKKTKGIAKNYYCGSFLKETDVRFFKQSTESIYFFWGLRSHFLRMNWKDWIHPFFAIDKIRKKNIILRSQNIKFFVSNEMIYEEFKSLGIAEDRLVIRPERFVEHDTSVVTTFDTPFTFLSIGTIRSEKRIPMIIDAFSRIKGDDYQYSIAGKCNDNKLNKIIWNEINGDCRINRDERRLSEEEYQDYFRHAHFLVLGDMKQESSVTNGTMMEALLMGIPIIAPAYNPYKHYIEKYQIGLLFDGYTVESLKNAMEQAIQIGAKSYQNTLSQFKQLFLYDSIQRQFRKDLYTVGIKPLLFHENPSSSSM